LPRKPGKGLSPREQVQALGQRQLHLAPPDVGLLTKLLKAPDAEIRAYAVYLLGVNGSPEGKDTLVKALKDKDALVRRRACEALIRAGIEPPVASIWPLLADPDRFLRTA